MRTDFQVLNFCGQQAAVGKGPSGGHGPGWGPVPGQERSVPDPVCGARLGPGEPPGGDREGETEHGGRTAPHRTLGESWVFMATHLYSSTWRETITSDSLCRSEWQMWAGSTCTSVWASTSFIHPHASQSSPAWNSRTTLLDLTAPTRVGILLKLNEKSIKPPLPYPHVPPVDDSDSIPLPPTTHPPHLIFPTFCKLPVKKHHQPIARARRTRGALSW